MSLILDLKKKSYNSCGDVVYDLHDCVIKVPYIYCILNGCNANYTSMRILDRVTGETEVLVEYAHPRLRNPKIKIFLRPIIKEKKYKYVGLEINCNKSGLLMVLRGFNISDNDSALQIIVQMVESMTSAKTVLPAPCQRQGYSQITVVQSGNMVSLRFK